MSVEGEEKSQEVEQGQGLITTIEPKVTYSMATPKITQKRGLIVSDLNLSNPEDRALSLCLKMMQQRKERQQRQEKLIDEIKKSRVTDKLEIGNVSRVIETDHFIIRHQYLREDHYRTARPKMATIKPIKSSELPSQNRKTSIKRQIQILQKSKILTQRYQDRKIVQEMLDDLIDNAITMHQRKKRFFFGAIKGKNNKELEKEWERRMKGKSGSLSLSRVFDINLTPPQDSEKEEYDKDSSQENEEQKEVESSASESSSEGNKDSQSDEENQPEEQEEKQQQEQNKSEQQDEAKSNYD